MQVKKTIEMHIAFSFKDCAKPSKNKNNVKYYKCILSFIINDLSLAKTENSIQKNK